MRFGFSMVRMRLMRKIVLRSLPTLFPGVVFAQAGGPIPVGSTDIAGFFRIACIASNWIFAFALVLAVAVLVFVGVTFMTARGDEQQLTTAKRYLGWALVGVAVVVLAKTLVAVVGTLVGVTAIAGFLCTA